VIPEDEPSAPPGVTLRDPEDSTATRRALESGIMKSMDRYANGFSYGGVRLELVDLKYTDKEEYSLKDQAEAKASDSLLHRRLRGTVRLVDEETNKVLDTKKNMTLARVPYLTERNTFINNGSEFSPVSQSRLLPGTYARRRANGELENHFNTRPGTGSAMRVSFEPTTAQYRLKIGSSDLHAYSIFRDLGVTDEELSRRWGPEILASNKSKYSKHALARAYRKSVPKWERDEGLPFDEKVAAIRAAMDRAQVSDAIMRRNLPNLYSQEKAASWRRAGAVIQIAQDMIKRSSATFAPDMSPDEVSDDWVGFFDGVEKAAGFEPDIEPNGMREVYNSIYGNHGPQLASMREWPKHWLDDENQKGWLQWYEKYHDGQRGETDEHQKKRWKSFKARHGAQFVAKPTPRRAFALRNWGIDPLKMLPGDKALQVEEEMEKYRRGEFVKWFMNRHDFDDDAAINLSLKAGKRGAEMQEGVPTPRALMAMALDGYIQPEDLK